MRAATAALFAAALIASSVGFSGSTKASPAPAPAATHASQAR
jgi:hypothetical protein